MTFFHGRLKVSIKEAKGLLDTDTALFNLFGGDVTDPFVTGDFGTAWLFKTKYINNCLNPVWNQDFDVYVCHHASKLSINVRDKETIGSVQVAGTSIEAEELFTGEVIEGWYDLKKPDDDDDQQEVQGQILFSVQYIPKADLVDELANEIQNSYFEARQNCRMTLYQDAETPQLSQFNGLNHPDGSPYVATRAWFDLYESIRNAQKFIYITGWSVYTSIQLIRGEEDPDGLSNVGELLKSKADEGVRVLMLLWNEAMSEVMGLMGTHDTETRDFFAGSNVECVLVSRQKPSSEELFDGTFVSTCYTHHQKTVICDAPLDDDESIRRVIAFIGGIDITDGRYDSPEFPLFKTIPTLHKDDFYQNCVPGATEQTGPREPWHDIHAKVEGQIALDIMKNFEDRWCKQSGEDMEGKLLDLDESEFHLDAPANNEEHDGGPWTVQLFRSITNDSCVMDHTKYSCLHTKGGRLVENSIQQCMIRQIRKANNYIYMENQYFLGSAYDWLDDSTTLSYHLIPSELTKKIIDKISDNEMFKVYIVIPMFPEGDPTSGAIQEILMWQYRTMEMMYSKIGQAIKDYGSDCHPTDYLSFYCLAKRESPDEVPIDELEEPENEQVKQVRQSLRHPVYVHSKMSIFDDEYILVGSANINERSLGGNRDTEIAAGGYQPGHTVEEVGDPRGSVHTFRMALWSTHFGGYNEDFLNPSSNECLDSVKQITQDFWKLYTAEEPEHSDVHALPYPINVDDEGNVLALEPPWDCFPDTTASVLGQKSGFLPVKMTT